MTYNNMMVKYVTELQSYGTFLFTAGHVIEYFYSTSTLLLLHWSLCRSLRCFAAPPSGRPAVLHLSRPRRLQLSARVSGHFVPPQICVKAPVVLFGPHRRVRTHESQRLEWFTRNVWCHQEKVRSCSTLERKEVW